GVDLVRYSNTPVVVGHQPKIMDADVDQAQGKGADGAIRDNQAVGDSSSVIGDDERIAPRHATVSSGVRVGAGSCDAHGRESCSLCGGVRKLISSQKEYRT